MANGNKEKKVIKHRFLNEHTFAGTLLLTVAAFILCEPIIAGTFNGVAGIIFGKESLITSIATAIGAIIGSLLTMLIFRRFFYPEYIGSVKVSFPVKWIPIGIAVSLISLLSMVLVSIMNHSSLGMVTLEMISVACLGGSARKLYSEVLLHLTL